MVAGGADLVFFWFGWFSGFGLFAFTWVEGAWCLALDLLMGVGCCLVLSVF